MLKEVLQYAEAVPDRAALVSYEGVVTYSELAKFPPQLSDLGKELAGARIAVRNLSSLQLAMFIPHLEGLVGLVLLLPVDIGEADCFAICRNMGISEVLNGRDGLVELQSLETCAYAKTPVSRTLWLLCTSGTTGKPKVITHDMRTLTTTLKRNLEIGGQFKWGLLYDLTRFAGLQVYLQSIVGASTLMVADLSMNLPSVVQFLVKGGCNALSSTPSMWRKVLMLPSSRNLALRQITLGGEIADQNLLTALSHNFPEAKISHIYASTESGVGFSVTDKLSGFPVKYLEEGVGEASLKIRNGVLWIKPSRPQLENGNEVDEFGYICTKDIVEVKSGRVYFLGRETGVINVGGNKVFPEEVEQVLLSHPLVSEARVYAKPNSIMGSLVVADVVLKGGVDQDLSPILREYCTQKLAKYKVPYKFQILTTLAVASTGKVSRKG